MRGIPRDQSGNIFAGDGLTRQALLPPFWAQLTAYDGVRYYAWQEVLPFGPATFTPLGGGRSGTLARNPAYDPNGAVVAPLPAYALLRLGYLDTAGLDWTYTILARGAGAGGTSAGLELTGFNPTTGAVGPDFLGVSHLYVDERQLDLLASGFPGLPPEVRVRFNGARKRLSPNVPLILFPTGTINATMTFDLTDFDTDGYAIAPNILVPPVDGYYAVGANITYVIVDAAVNVPWQGTVRASIWVNYGGPNQPICAAQAPPYYSNGPPGVLDALSLSGVIRLFRGGFVKVLIDVAVYDKVGNPLGIGMNGYFSAYGVVPNTFWMYLLGP